MPRKKIYKKVKIEAVYSLDDGYISFPYNPHHGKEFENVPVSIKKEEQNWCGVTVEVDIINIGGEKPLQIECELVKKTITNDGTLILKICQDWG